MGDLAQSRLALVFGRWHMLTHLSLWEFARRLIKCRLPVFLKSEERLSCGFSTGFRTDVSLQGSWDTIFDNVSFSFLPIFFKNPGGVNFTRKKINRCQHSFFVTALLIGLSQCFYDRTFFFYRGSFFFFGTEQLHVLWKCGVLYRSLGNAGTNVCGDDCTKLQVP